MIQVHKDFSCPKFNKVKEDDKKVIDLLEGHSSRINAGLISSDNEEILTAAGGGTFGDTDNKIRVWGIKTKQQLKILNGHQHKILAISLNQNKELLFSGDITGMLIVWDFQTSTILHKEAHDSKITKLYYFEENSQVYVIQDGSFTVYQLEKHMKDGEKKYELNKVITNKMNIQSSHMNLNKKQLNICAFHSIFIFDCYTNEKIDQFTFNQQISTDCIVDCLNNVAIFGHLNEVKFWDYEKEILSFRYTHKYRVYSVFFADNQTKVVSCTLFSTQIWDNFAKIQLHFIDFVGKILWVPDNLEYLLTCRLKNVGLYSFSEQKYKDLFKIHNTVIISAYSIESKNLIITLGVENFIKIWDSVSFNLRSQILLDKNYAGLKIYPSKCYKYLIASAKDSVLVLSVGSILNNSKNLSDEIEKKANFSEDYVDNEYDRATYNMLVSWKV